MAMPRKRFVKKRETQKFSGKASKARTYLLEYMIQRYDDEVSHYEIVSKMHLPPMSIKKQDQIEHIIKELLELGVIEHSYDSSSIKRYMLRDNPESFKVVFRESMDSKNRLELYKSAYFSKYFNETNISKWIEVWRGKYSEYLSKGLLLAEEDKGEDLGIREFSQSIIDVIGDLLIKKDTKLFSSVPILTFMIMDGDKGAKAFWEFMEDMYESFPEIFAFGNIIVKDIKRYYDG